MKVTFWILCLEVIGNYYIGSRLEQFMKIMMLFRDVGDNNLKVSHFLNRKIGAYKMLIKERDRHTNELHQLKSFSKSKLSQKQRFLVDREIRNIKSGEQGEEDSAYYIDFYYKNSNNWAVLHDLRLELNGFSAQIDHILINRMFDIYILESKNYYHGVKITEKGEFLIWDGKRYQAVESPIEQNERHIHLLKKFFAEHHILPKRLGVTIRPRFVNCVLISPKSRIMRPSQKNCDTTWVLAPDTLKKKIEEEFHKLSHLKAFSNATKMSSLDSIVNVAEKLKSFHSPKSIDFRAKFGIPESISQGKKQNGSDVSESSSNYCFKCKKPISTKVANFCWENKSRFKGRAYCFDCQKLFPNRG